MNLILKLIEKLLFIEKVERGLKDVEESRVYAFNDVKDRFLNKTF